MGGGRGLSEDPRDSAAFAAGSTRHKGKHINAPPTADAATAATKIESNCQSLRQSSRALTSHRRRRGTGVGSAARLAAACAGWGVYLYLLRRGYVLLDIYPARKDLGGTHPLQLIRPSHEADKAGPAAPYDDETIEVAAERERCRRYGWVYNGRTTRRRIFVGGLIADDSWHPLRAVAAEAYNIYHTVVFVESNTTQSYFPRKLRFTPGSSDRMRLERIFGPNTNVAVEFYYDSPVKENNPKEPLVREHMQRALITRRWAAAGMTPADIGIVADADETFTRDFLRAAQICDVPAFRPGQDCLHSKMWAAAVVFESGPDCIVQQRLWHHPDMIIGECVDQIGDAAVHPPGKRVFRDVHGKRAKGYGDGGFGNMTGTSMYPLLDAGDFRNYLNGRQPRLFGKYNWVALQNSTNQPTGYTGFHFHNFFNDARAIRRKYRTYGHPNPMAHKLPLMGLGADLNLTVACVLNRSDSGNHALTKDPIRRVVGGMDSVVGPKPIFFDERYRRERGDALRKIIEDEIQT